MKLALSALEAAVRQHLDPALAARVAPCAAALKGEAAPQAVEDAQAGELLLRAFLGRPEGVDGADLGLRYLHLVFATETLSFTAAEALAHPLLQGWAADDLAEALGAPIIAGARLTRLAPGAPLHGEVRITRLGDQLAATALLDFATASGPASALAFYGFDAPRAPGLITTSAFSGEALLRIGRQAASARAEPELRDDLVTGSVVGTAHPGEPINGRLH